MNRHPTIEDLSAYIDGEVRDTKALAAHIQSCAGCARRHMELEKLSHHVRALKAPEVRTSFARSVLAAIEQAPRRPRFRFPLPWALPVAAAAALAIVVSVLRSPQESPQPASPPELPAPFVVVAEPTPLPDGQDLLDRLEMALVQDPDVEWILTGMMLDETGPIELSTEEMIMALTNEAWFDSFPDDERWGIDPDLDTALQELDAAETEALFGLLIESARGDSVL